VGIDYIYKENIILNKEDRRRWREGYVRMYIVSLVYEQIQKQKIGKE